MATKLELTWYGKEERVAIEPRILVENKELSNIEKDVNTENILIHGDNLLALKALEQKYSKSIQCIYIDPPYNCNALGVPFDDNIEHSIWLSLMRERLIVLNNLLADDGVFCCQCDDEEQAYLKVLCDEVFGRNNFLNMIVVESGEVFGKKAAHITKKFVKVKDYILMYARKSDNFEIKPLWTKTNEPYDTHYSNFINEETLEKSSIVDIVKEDENLISEFLKYGVKISIKNFSKMMQLSELFKRFIIENSSSIYCDQPFSAKVPEEIEKTMTVGKIFKFKNMLIFKTGGSTIRYYKPFSDSIKYSNDYNIEFTRTTARGDLWKNYHQDMRNVDDEGSVSFKNSKKPERLIHDILLSFTKQGDMVLDSFLGSGTTCAVAHKMNRKWIGIEMGEHAYTLCKPRLDSVIQGEKSGVSNRSNWLGGGGYRFYELAPTLIKEDDFGQEIINPEYNKEMLSAAVALHESYQYAPDEECYWKQAKNNNSYLYVTTQHIKREHIERIKLDIKDGEFLLVVCKSFESNCIQGEKNIIVKKIPQSLLKNCEFNKDNYNLNIINPPLYEEEEDDE